MLEFYVKAACDWGAITVHIYRKNQNRSFEYIKIKKKFGHIIIHILRMLFSLLCIGLGLLGYLYS